MEPPEIRQLRLQVHQLADLITAAIARSEETAGRNREATAERIAEPGRRRAVQRA